MAITLDERRYRDRVRAKAKNDAKAIAAGRVPGRVGRTPIQRSPEEKEALRVAINRRNTLSTIARIKRRRAERALAEGREPGKVGQPRVLTDEQRKAGRLASLAKYREANLALCKARSVKCSKQRRDRLKVENPEMYLAQVKANRAHMSAKKYGMPRNPESLTAIVYRVLQASEGKCAVCASTEQLELDHILALVRGGTNAETNLQFAA